MTPRIFVGETAAEAVQLVRNELGPDAVVLNVRRLPPEGLARLWQKPRIEVTALKQDAAPRTDPTGAALAELRDELVAIKQSLSSQRTKPALPGEPNDHRPQPKLRIAELLERGGLMPAHVQRVLEAAGVGPEPPGSYCTATDIDAVRRALVSLWPPPPSYLSNCHVFVGPPGSGKTTVLCRWLAQAVLAEGQPARVLRVDGDVANTAESLSVFAEVLGVPVDRCCPESTRFAGAGPVFVDLPGVTPSDLQAMDALRKRLATFPDPQVHLVLNGAYEQSVLLSQARAFRALPITDVVVSHVDEDCRWAKLWNLALGTNYTIGFLSGGQNVPGQFHIPDPELLLAAQFPKETGPAQQRKTFSPGVANLLLNRA